MSIELMETLRSLGFGALLGGGTLGLIYLLMPELFHGAATLETAAGIGGLLGAGTHQLIDAWFIKGLLGQVGRFLSYYSKLIQLALLWRVLPRDLARRLLREITERHFLDKPPPGPGNRLLPPGGP